MIDGPLAFLIPVLVFALCNMLYGLVMLIIYWLKSRKEKETP